jgi:8-amino-7-oxononanoate synthase
MAFQTQIREALSDLEAAGLLRSPVRISGPQGPEVEIDGRRVLCFCSNNYLGLANHPALVAATEAGLHREGVGAASSRLITGTMDAHREAEVAYANFVRAPAAALFSSGYAANVGTVQALAGSGDVIFSDALNHASLIDGCRLSRAQVHVYSHRDVDHLESLLREHRPRSRRALIITDSLFSMDGVTAPLRGVAALARSFDAGLMVDEAHALGVFGPDGRGLSAAQGVEPDVIVGTLGKSFGVVGAFTAASEEIVSLIRNRARSFVYSTAPPPLVARAAITALALGPRGRRCPQNIARKRSQTALGAPHAGLRGARWRKSDSPCFNRGQRSYNAALGEASRPRSIRAGDPATDGRRRNRQASADAYGYTSTRTHRTSDRRIRVHRS